LRLLLGNHQTRLHLFWSSAQELFPFKHHQVRRSREESLRIGVGGGCIIKKDFRHRVGEVLNQFLFLVHSVTSFNSSDKMRNASASVIGVNGWSRTSW
jgi:hypothetical protein